MALEALDGLLPCRPDVPREDPRTVLGRPSILLNNRANPARIAGRQAQNTDAVHSTVDQNVVSTLSQVGSAVRPKWWRELRRMQDINVML